MVLLRGLVRILLRRTAYQSKAVLIRPSDLSNLYGVMSRRRTVRKPDLKSAEESDQCTIFSVINRTQR